MLKASAKATFLAALLAGCGFEGEVGMDPGFDGVSDELAVLDDDDAVTEDSAEGEREALSLQRCRSYLHVMKDCWRLRNAKPLSPVSDGGFGARNDGGVGGVYTYRAEIRHYTQSRYSNGYKRTPTDSWHSVPINFSKPIEGVLTTCLRPRCR